MIENLFTLNTRRLGKVGEIFISKHLGSSPSKVNDFDLIDKVYGKVEVKFSRAMFKHKVKITESNVLSQIELSNNYNRAIAYDKRMVADFDSNIQQVKAYKFDTLFYGIFFLDRVVLFKAKSEDIKNIKNYADIQHSNNYGEGQFHINQSTLSWHEKHNLYKVFTYDEFFAVLDK